MTEAGGRIAETEVREAVPQEDSAGRFSGNRELLLRARAGDKAALEQLVIDNAGLVRSIAVRFRDRGTDMEDLMQIGTIGMMTGRKYSASYHAPNLSLLLSALAISSDSGRMSANMANAMIVVFRIEVTNCSFWNMF